MDAELYHHVSMYLQHGILPPTFTSTKSNFVSLARKFTVVGNELQRTGRWVVKADERETIFDSYHQHAGTF